MTEPVDCVIYRCAKQAEMYLYLRSDLEVSDVPEALRKRTGMLTQVMALNLTPERQLARVDVQQVLAMLAEQGYFLQLPPRGQVSVHLTSGG